MRVIAGKYRGMVLHSFRGEDIRPTADRVKESVFQILSSRLVGARVLDLFCGSGALGIECLSRGAGEVVFNDLSDESLSLCKKNLSRISGNFRVTRSDFRACLSRAEGKFDLIFADPPYKEDYFETIFSLIQKNDLLASGGLLVYESENDLSPVSGAYFLDRRKYGRTVVTMIQKEQTN